jgi:hypothetical protein
MKKLFRTRLISVIGKCIPLLTKTQAILIAEDEEESAASKPLTALTTSPPMQSLQNFWAAPPTQLQSTSSADSSLLHRSANVHG